MNPKRPARKLGRPPKFLDGSVMRAELRAELVRVAALYRGEKLQNAQKQANAELARELHRINPRWKGGPRAAYELLKYSELRWNGKGYAGLTVPGPPTYHTIRDEILRIARNPVVGADELRDAFKIAFRDAVDRRLDQVRQYRNVRWFAAVVDYLVKAARRDLQRLREDPRTDRRERSIYREFSDGDRELVSETVQEGAETELSMSSCRLELLISVIREVGDNQFVFK